jgi:hypothetical protein
MTHFVRELAHASFCRGQGVHHTAVFLALPLCMSRLCLSACCVGTRGRASGKGKVLLADMQCAQAWLRCVNRIAGR